MPPTQRFAVVSTHPTQYYAPWFCHMAQREGLEFKVFYLWDFGVTEQVDAKFGHKLKWDVPLLEGYGWEFVPNRSRAPGTGHFRGIDNPALPARLADYGPAAVLCMGYNYATFMRLLLRRHRPLLLRGDSHRLVPRSGLKAWLKRRAITALFRRFAACLYVGSANRDYLRQHGVADERLFFSPHAVDNERFTAEGAAARPAAADWRRELGIPPDHRVILFVGKFEDKKRPQDLLTAFARAALPAAALLFVGAGALEADLRRQAAGVPGVYFAPFQNQSRMPLVYAAADVVVLPSRGPGETWGLCINEAMCLAKPVIVSSHVGCAADLVQSGVNGLVFPAGDVAALADALRQMLANPERLSQMGAASKERIAHYSYSQATAGLREALLWLQDKAVPVAPGNRGGSRWV